ncbi:hypothetical protein CANARDRAFT_29464 [[Candida] arabinofermentans NRRL YB-2248]|uniref:Prefoldin subunit 1 n=1 Tax=[Candida] arabinofermentans NRRL YB-2248 TaxID=983967 RepID=A0A1E4SWX8_9ASCO|nr:hypothetical protein CANARDRAFT_29464 [[Candida] arabinofermentans NRRL YB-2248]
MSMSQDSLQKLMIEMEDQLSNNQKDLNVTKSNLGHLIQQNKVLNLQISEIKRSKVDSVWQSSGKAFLKINTDNYLKKLQDDMDENKEMIKSLKKKQEYLETSIEKTYEHINRFITPPPR